MPHHNKQLYIELYNYKPAWLDLSETDRKELTDMAEGAIAEMENAGVAVIGFGFNDTNTDRRAPYDFFCVYTMPQAEFARGFEAQIEASGWYDYFDQINASGHARSASDLLADHVKGITSFSQ